MFHFVSSFLKPRHSHKDPERGQMLLIVAFSMVGLLVAAGLAVDGGVLFLRKAQLDRATDSAALAGVVDLYHFNIGGSIGITNPSQIQDRLDVANLRGIQLMAANGVIVGDPADPPVYTASTSDHTLNQRVAPPPCIDQANPSNEVVDWDTYEYCGEIRQGSAPGAVRYFIRTEWYVDTFFMRLLGFETIPVRAKAEAEYYALADVYASRTSVQGILRVSNQAVFGPDICRAFGDRYVPLNGSSSSWNPEWIELRGAYTYRLVIPPTYEHNSVRIELFDPDTYNLPVTTFTYYERNGTSHNYTSSYDRKDPRLVQTGEPEEGNYFWFRAVEENRGTGTPGVCGEPGSYTASRMTTTLFRLYYYAVTPEGSFVPVDLAYYIGKDGNPDSAPGEAALTDLHWVSPTWDTAEGNAERMPAIDLAYMQGDPQWSGFNWYPMGANLVCSDDLQSGQTLCFLKDNAEPVAEPEDCETIRAAHDGQFETIVNQYFNRLQTGTAVYTDADRCSGNGDFIVNLNTETSDIFTAGDGTRILYLDVRVIDGSSENGFEVWAGPPRDVYTVPSNVNSRNMFILNFLQAQQTNPIVDHPHDSEGIMVYGLGHLPMNSNINAQTDIPLSYFGPEMAGQEVSVQLFDADAGANGPIYFYLDTVPFDDWIICFDDPGYNSCANAQYLGTTINLSASRPPGDAGRSWIKPSMQNIWATYTFTLPSEYTGVNFYGGILWAHYKGGQDDTYGWRLSSQGLPYLTE